MSGPPPDLRVPQSLENLSRAMDRLAEALAHPPAGSLAIDGTIQRFEFTIELFWKTLRRCLEAEGIAAGTPRECLVAAFQAGWTDDEAPWLGMLRDRNLTSHTYNEEQARLIYEHIRQYFPVMQRTQGFLRSRFLAGP